MFLNGTKCPIHPAIKVQVVAVSVRTAEIILDKFHILGNISIQADEIDELEHILIY